MVVADVIGKQALQVAFIEGNNVTEQVPPATLDPPLSNSVLPGTLERRANRPDGHRAYRDRDLQTIFGIPIKDQKSGRRLIGKGLAQLLHDPDAGGMSCDVEMHNPPPTMADDKEAVEDMEREGWDGKEVHCGDHFPMIAQKSEPTFGRLWVSRCPAHPTRDGSLGHIETEHEKFAVNTWGAPDGVLRDHPKDQVADLVGNPSPANSPACSGNCPPIDCKPRSVPTYHRLRAHHDESLFPSRPEPPRQNPEELIECFEPGPRMPSLQCRQVVGEERDSPEGVYDECRRGEGLHLPGVRWHLSCEGCYRISLVESNIPSC